MTGGKPKFVQINWG